nr:hypothetical protein [Vibrio mimicus]
MINNRLKEQTEGKINGLAVASHITHIFTDFFDTIVSRQCHPEEIKRKWAQRIIDQFELDISLSELYQLRIALEAELCNSNYIEHGDVEFCYKDLTDLLRLRLSMEYIPEEKFFCILRSIELELEKRYQHINEDVLFFLKKQKDNGCRIVVVSDFYMDANFIIELSKHHKFDYLVDDYYVSSDYIKTKRSGNLYSHVLNETQTLAFNVLMIGDNLHSDKNMPEIHGINSFHIVRDESLYKRSLSDDCNEKYVSKKFKKIFKEKKYHFDWMTIPLYIFIRRLYNNLIKNDSEHVIFLAREGEFLKELFDAYQQCIPGRKINTHYMYASRRGTYITSLYELNANTFDKLLEQYSSMSISVFLDSLGLSEYKGRIEESLVNIDFNIVKDNFKESEEFKLIISDPIFKDVFYAETKRRREYLKSYINILVPEGAEINLVDVGWKGSIQDNIQKALKRKIKGYYCSVLSGAVLSQDNLKIGLLFHPLLTKNSRFSGYEIFNEFRASFEVFCAASHGSLIKYTCAPDFGVLENNQYELDLYNEKIRPIQNKIKDTFIELVEVENKHARTLSNVSSYLIPIYKKRVLLPSNSEMEDFSSYKHYENFGVFDYSAFFTKSKGRITYLKSLILNPQYTLGREWWKPLGFKNNGLSFFKYPYFLYKSLKN